MGMRHPPKTKQQLLNEVKAKKEKESYWGQFILSCAILVDRFDFSPEELAYYRKDYETLCESYLKNNEDISAMRANLKDYCGFDVISDKVSQ